jgi:hypothetical protein
MGADGTALTWTEQGAYLDDIDGPQAPSLRKEGTTEMLDGLTVTWPRNHALTAEPNTAPSR